MADCGDYKTQAQHSSRMEVTNDLCKAVHRCAGVSCVLVLFFLHQAQMLLLARVDKNVLLGPNNRTLSW